MLAVQPEDNCPREQRAEQELLQQQRPECVCSGGASQDQDGTKCLRKLSWNRPWKETASLQLCVLFSRCANMSCPSVTDRSGLITVWRPSCPAHEAEAPAKVLWVRTNIQHSLVKLWYEKGRIIMNCKCFG